MQKGDESQQSRGGYLCYSINNPIYIYFTIYLKNKYLNISLLYLILILGHPIYVYILHTSMHLFARAKDVL